MNITLALNRNYILLSTPKSEILFLIKNVMKIFMKFFKFYETLNTVPFQDTDYKGKTNQTKIPNVKESAGFCSLFCTHTESHLFSLALVHTNKYSDLLRTSGVPQRCSSKGVPKKTVFSICKTPFRKTPLVYRVTE